MRAGDMRRLIAVSGTTLLVLVGASVATTAQQPPSALSAAQQLMLVPASKYPGRVYVLPATLETTQWGWFDNAELPRLTVDSGGYSCLRNHVAFPWATVARSHHRRAQEAAHRLAWTWADDDYGSRLRQRRRTGRRFADQNQQNCRATLGCEFQHPRPVRTVSERVS